MSLDSPSVVVELRSRNGVVVLYFATPPCHAPSLTGGTTPVIGFHSTIDRPDSVSRVAPPTTTVTNISAATASSHSPPARRRGGAGDGTLVMRSLACWRRGPYSCTHAPAIAPVSRFRSSQGLVAYCSCE